MLNGFGMASLGRFGKASTLVDDDGDVQPCGLFQEVQLANYSSVVEFGVHVRTVGILMQECCGHRGRRLGVGT